MRSGSVALDVPSRAGGAIYRGARRARPALGQGRKYLYVGRHFRGFFEPDQFESIRAHLPAPLRRVIEFPDLTGWRVKSEILPLEWRQVDFSGRVVRLDPGTTTNKDGRTFPFTAALGALLVERRSERDRLKAQGRIVPIVFHRNGHLIRDFRGAWKERVQGRGRTSAVRNLERAGVPRSAAMKMVGHKSEAIYRRYVDEAMLREAAARVDQLAGMRQGQSQGHEAISTPLEMGKQ